MRKLNRIAIAVVTCGAVALTGTAAIAGGGAETKVTIKGGGEIYGYVKSPNENKCANDRRVAVYKQSGNQQDPGNDNKIGTDNASPSGDKFKWSVGNPGNGKFYARARKIDGCQGDISRTVNG